MDMGPLGARWSKDTGRPWRPAGLPDLRRLTRLGGGMAGHGVVVGAASRGSLATRNARRLCAFEPCRPRWEAAGNHLRCDGAGWPPDAALFDRPASGRGSALRAGAPPMQQGARIPAANHRRQKSPDIPQTVIRLSRFRKGLNPPARSRLSTQVVRMLSRWRQPQWWAVDGGGDVRPAPQRAHGLLRHRRPRTCSQPLFDALQDAARCARPRRLDATSRVVVCYFRTTRRTPAATFPISLLQR
jgi:hypothetical protein